MVLQFSGIIDTVENHGQSYLTGLDQSYLTGLVASHSGVSFRTP